MVVRWRWSRGPGSLLVSIVLLSETIRSMLTCTYSTGVSSPASLCVVYLVAGKALGEMRSNVWPLELVIWTAETKTGGAGQQTLRRMRSCGRLPALSLSLLHLVWSFRYSGDPSSSLLPTLPMASRVA